MAETTDTGALLQRGETRLESLAQSHPRGYLLLASAVALAGYGWLLVFPWLVLAGLSGGYEALVAQPSVAWTGLLVWSSVALAAALVTARMVRFKPDLPAGIPFERRSAPALFKLVDELLRHYGRPGIDRVVLTEAFELSLVKTPRWVVPVWSVNTLAVGLPLMQSLSSGEFSCLLARRLGQFSKRYNPLQNWLYQLRGIWPQYVAAREIAGPGFEPVRWFFSAFAPLYEWISLPAARRDELAADSYAMELRGDEEVLEAITTEAVCRLYLEEKYWPVYRRLSASVREAMPRPHAGMPSVLQAGLRGERGRQWLARAMEEAPRRDDPVPALASRVENIGFLEARMDEMASVSAATVYLGPAVEDLEKALDAPSPRRIPQQRASGAFGWPPGVFRALLTRLSSGRQAGAPHAENHCQIASSQ